MKKLLALCLTVVLCLCCLASCVSIIPHAHTEGDVWEYNENQHWKPINCVFNICEINIVSYEHVDENNDGVCDVCGYLAKIGGDFEFEYLISDFAFDVLPYLLLWLAAILVLFGVKNKIVYVVALVLSAFPNVFVQTDSTFLQFRTRTPDRRCRS